MVAVADGHPRHGHDGPDTCEIGHTWLAPSAIRTGANTEMKRLMLTYAFETWDAQCVCFHTDARNERSRRRDRADRRPGSRASCVRTGWPPTCARGTRPGIRSPPPEWPAVRDRLAELAASRAVAS